MKHYREVGRKGLWLEQENKQKAKAEEGRLRLRKLTESKELGFFNTRDQFWAEKHVDYLEHLSKLWHLDVRRLHQSLEHLYMLFLAHSYFLIISFWNTFLATFLNGAIWQNFLSTISQSSTDTEMSLNSVGLFNTCLVLGNITEQCSF